MTNTKVLEKKQVFKSRHFTVEQVEIERNGKTFKKDFVERVPIVLVLPYTKDYNIYLESQYRDAREAEGLEVVAGSIDPQEDTLAAAKRELEEETGLTAKEWKQIAMWDLSVNMKAKIHVFFCTELHQGEAHLDEDEEIAVVKMPLTDALAKIESGEITAASHIALLLLFDKMRQEGKL